MAPKRTGGGTTKGARGIVPPTTKIRREGVTIVVVTRGGILGAMVVGMSGDERIETSEAPRTEIGVETAGILWKEEESLLLTGRVHQEYASSVVKNGWIITQKDWVLALMSAEAIEPV